MFSNDENIDQDFSTGGVIFNYDFTEALYD